MWTRQTRRRSGSTSRWALRTGTPTSCSPACRVAAPGRARRRWLASGPGPGWSGEQRPVARGYRAEHLGVELYLIERHPIVDTKIEVLSHPPTSIAERLPLGSGIGYGPPASCRMTQQSHFHDHLRVVPTQYQIATPGGESRARRDNRPPTVR